MDIIFPSYSRSFKRFELGQTPNADAAFAELDAGIAKLEEERRQAEAELAAAEAAAAAAAAAPAADSEGSGLTFAVMAKPTVDMSQISKLGVDVSAARAKVLAIQARIASALAAQNFMGPPAPADLNQQTVADMAAGRSKKSNVGLYVGVGAALLATIGAVWYFTRRK
jgi:hypothetical protein